MSALTKTSGGSISNDVESTRIDGEDMVTDKGDVGQSSKRPGDGSEDNCCNMPSLEENVGSSSVHNSSNSAKCFSRNDKEKSQNKTDEVEANVVSVCIDDDSSDDFQVSSIRNTQVAPLPAAQKPSKAKKRKATKKSKNKTATGGVRNRNNVKKPPVNWSCSACTFINDGQLLECSVCLTPCATTEDEKTCIPKSTDLGFEISIEQSCDDVEMVEDAGVLEDFKSINSVIENGGINATIVKHDMLLDGIDGSASNDTGHTAELPDSTIVFHGLLTDQSMAAPTDVSKTTDNSTIPKKETAVYVSDNSQVVEPALPPWTCTACTFLNMSQMIECSICMTPRRRSQRLSATKTTCTFTCTVAAKGREKDCINKNKSSKRRRWEGDKMKKDDNPQDIGVNMVSSSFTCIDESSAGNSISHCDHNISIADNDSLTPEPVESTHDTDSVQAHGGLQVDSSEDSSGGIKPKPRKRLRLEEVEADSSMTEDIGDFSDDSDVVCDNRTFTCPSSVSSSTAQRESVSDIPFDGKDITSSDDCVLSTDEDKKGATTHQKHVLNNCQIDKNDFEVYCDISGVKVSDDVEAIDCSAVPLPVSSSEVTFSANSSPRLQSGSKVVENLDELKAAAEAVFMSEWEDDDEWWEEAESCSGQSSFPSSSETASVSPTVPSPGFTKCSDLYSVTELKNKLQTTPEACTTTAVDNVQQVQLAEGNPDNDMSSSLANQYTFMPDTAPVIEEEEAEEPEDVPEAMKLKFCLSLYTERVYLYNEVSYLYLVLPSI